MAIKRRRLNLIPPATQRRLAFERLARTWSTTIVLCGLTAGGLLALEWTQGMFASHELQRLEVRYAPLAKLSADNEELKTQIAELRAREQLSLRLSRKEHGITALAAVTVATRDGDQDVYLMSVDYDGPPEDAKLKERPERWVQLVGAGVDSVAVAALAQRLRAVGAFEAVAVESTDPLPGADDRLRRFQMRCKL